MTNYPFSSLDEFQDIEARNYAASAASLPEYDEEELLKALAFSSRDNARTPVQWDDSPNAGFTTGTPWLPVNPNAGTVNAKQAVADEDSVFHHYRRLIQLRHELPIIVHGRFDLLLDEDEHIFAYTRTLDDQQLLVVANFSDGENSAAVENADTWAGEEVLLGNYPAPDPNTGLLLRPWEVRVYYRH